MGDGCYNWQPGPTHPSWGLLRRLENGAAAGSSPGETAAIRILNRGPRLPNISRVRV